MSTRKMWTLTWRLTFLAVSLTTLFWGSWWLFAGRVPVVHSIKWDDKSFWQLPFGVSQWLVIPFVAILVAALIQVICRISRISDDTSYKKEFSLGLIAGLYVGIIAGLGACLGACLGVGLVVGLIAGIVAGPVVGLVACLVAGLGACLIAGLGAGLGACLGVGLGAGLGAGLIAGIVAGPVVGLVAGLGAGLVAGLGAGLGAGLVGILCLISVALKGLFSRNLWLNCYRYFSAANIDGD